MRSSSCARAALAVLAILPLPFAQAAGLTLSEAVAAAHQRTPALQAAAAGVRAAEASLDASRLRPNPVLNIEAENVLGSGPYSGFSGGEKTYSLSLPVELGGKRQARIGVAEAERSAAGISVVTARAEVTLRITLAYTAAIAAERRLALAREELALAERSERVARERVDAGKASPLERQRGQVILINAQVKEQRLGRAADTASGALARLLDLPAPSTLAAPWFDDFRTTAPSGRDGALLPVAAADAQVAAARARSSAARSARIPDLVVTAGTRRYGDSRDSAAVLGLSIPLPVFNRGGAELARTRAELERAQAERGAIVRDAEQAAENALAEVADTQAAAAAANGPALAAASEAARIARIGYAEGKFSQLDLIEAERSLAETRAVAIDALAALHEARARLARLQGSSTPLYKD